MFNLKTLPKTILIILVAPMTGKAEITGDTAIAKAIFFFEIPLVNCVWIGDTTNFLHSFESLLEFFSSGSSMINCQLILFFRSMKPHRSKLFIVRLSVNSLHDRNITCLKSRFAVLEIIVPFANKCFAESLLPHSR